MIETEVIELAQALIRSPSVNPPADTRACAALILDKFRENDIDAEIIEEKQGAANVVARLPGDGRGKVLVLNGHLDVVLPGEGWRVDPFGGEIRGGMLYGRGSCDMKSGIASMVASMIDFKRSGRSFNGEIVFMGVADEETGSEYGTQLLLKKGIGKGADFAIVSEPTNLRLELGNRGLRWIDICVKGRASHAGRPNLGVNAIQYAAKLIDGIQSMKFENRNDAYEIPTPSISVTMINAGTNVNIIPNRCRLSVDRRMIPGETTETVMRELQDLVTPMLKEEKDLDVEIKMRPVNWDAYLISENEPIVRATRESFEAVTGRSPEILAKSAGTDASYLFHLGGTPTLLFGPGNQYMSHQVDECVSLEDLVIATQILVVVFNRLLGQ
jgi:acetylornithine deacetylase/succinyl-diaminopimelate desuccinylase family protein